VSTKIKPRLLRFSPYIHYIGIQRTSLTADFRSESPTEEDFNLTASISVIFVLTLLVSYLGGFYVSLQVNKEHTCFLEKNYFCHR
jgi:hypothetical protein